MARPRTLSPQARILLSILSESAGTWRHGYDLARQAGLKSGTLYPLLMRLETQGLLQAEWQPAAMPGRPPRHAYRLTAAGLESARGAESETPEGGFDPGRPVTA